MRLFTAKDFRVFEISSFGRRMTALRSRISPKLSDIGAGLAPGLSALVDQPVHLHVAKHMRRRVNPPDDTWAAFGLDKRGYKKDAHFKVAVSRNCVRLLFEVGPEYYEKAEWALRWNRDIRNVAETLTSLKNLSWFKDEHDEQPGADLAGWSIADFRSLSRDLTRSRDGQIVLGRRIDHDDMVGMDAGSFTRAALTTFRALAPVFLLHDARVRAPSDRQSARTLAQS